MTLLWQSPDLDGQATFRVEARSGGAVIVASGEVDILTSPALREAVLAAAEASNRIVIDLGAVTFIDSTGIGVIVAALGRHRQRSVSLVRPAPMVRKILQITTLDRLIPVLDSVDEALAHGGTGAAPGSTG